VIFVFPALVVKRDQRLRGVGAVIEQGGSQPVAAAVVAGDRHRCLDDPDLHPADHRGEGPVGEVAKDRRAADRGEPDQELGLGGGDLGQVLPGIKPAVHQHQHRGIQ
jgi:hypothetical protein